MKFKSNMEFTIKEGFLPNIYHSKKLKILEVSESTLIIKMSNAQNRCVFPVDNFRLWVKRGLLVNAREEKQPS